MPKTTFNQQISDVIKSQSTSIDELKAIEPIMMENCKSAIRSFYNYYFATLVLIILWFLVNNSIISEIKIFDVNITNTAILILAIPCLSVIAYYLTITYMAFNQLIDAGLKLIHRRLYPNIGETPLLELLIYPSFIELESVKVRLKDGLLSGLGFLLIAIGFAFTPILLNAIICYKLIMLYHNSWLIIIPIILSLIVLKTFLDIIFYIKQVQ